MVGRRHANPGTDKTLNVSAKTKDENFMGQASAGVEKFYQEFSLCRNARTGFA
jgi:hypothetical protein